MRLRGGVTPIRPTQSVPNRGTLPSHTEHKVHIAESPENLCCVLMAAGLLRWTLVRCPGLALTDLGPQTRIPLSGDT